MKPLVISTKNKLEEGQRFKISRFKELIKKTVPHKHDEYYELIFLRAGEGFHWIETEKYQVEAPEFYFLKPGQLHCWQFTAIPKGFVVLFKAEFFDAMRETPLQELIKGLNKTTRLQLTQAEPFITIFEQILVEYAQEAPYSTHIIHGYLRVLLSKILQLTEVQETILTPRNELYERFLELLSKECPRLHQVNDFATLLNTTPQNLNATCRKFSDRSAGVHIAVQLLLEAKRYILHTDKTVSEIADTLHFNDASYFIKFFKKHEGVTPLQFREKHFQ